MWKIYNEGKTLGTNGSKNGIIVLDYEEPQIGRITLEKCEKQFALTYCINGEMLDTIYGDEDELRQVVEGLKIELNFYKYLSNDSQATEKWIDDLYKRRNNEVPKPIDKTDGGFNDLRSFSLNYYLLDMFPEIKDRFFDFVGDDTYFYGAFITYADILMPYLISNIEKDNKVIINRFADLLEDISFSEDEYISNFFVIGLLEEIYFFDEDTKNKLLPYLKENTIKQYKEYDPYFDQFWKEVNDHSKIEKIMKDKCSRCGGRLAYRHENSSGMVYCIKCGNIEVVTTHFDSILNDDKEYSIDILPNEQITIEKIDMISKLTGLNYISSRKMLIEGGNIFKGKAVDAKKYYLKLTVSYINFSINPSYPFDYILQREGWFK